MKYLGKITDSKDLITLEKGEAIAEQAISDAIGETIHNVPSGGTSG